MIYQRKWQQRNKKQREGLTALPLIAGVKKMIEDIFDFFMTKIMPCIFMILVIGFICLIPSCIKYDVKRTNQVKECFMQDVKTKECEYILWKEELIVKRKEK